MISIFEVTESFEYKMQEVESDWEYIYEKYMTDSIK